MFYILITSQVDCEASLFAVIGAKDVDRLPSASTCYNTLKLPNCELQRNRWTWFGIYD